MISSPNHILEMDHLATLFCLQEGEHHLYALFSNTGNALTGHHSSFVNIPVTKASVTSCIDNPTVPAQSLEPL